MPDFNAIGHLSRWEPQTFDDGHKRPRCLRLVESGKVADLTKKVLGKPHAADQILYQIAVPLEAGFGKETLNSDDIQELAEHPDFPK